MKPFVPQIFCLKLTDGSGQHRAGLGWIGLDFSSAQQNAPIHHRCCSMRSSNATHESGHLCLCNIYLFIKCRTRIGLTFAAVSSINSQPSLRVIIRFSDVATGKPHLCPCRDPRMGDGGLPESTGDLPPPLRLPHADCCPHLSARHDVIQFEVLSLVAATPRADAPNEEGDVTLHTPAATATGDGVVLRTLHTWQAVNLWFGDNMRFNVQLAGVKGDAVEAWPWMAPSSSAADIKSGVRAGGGGGANSTAVAAEGSWVYDGGEVQTGRWAAEKAASEGGSEPGILSPTIPSGGCVEQFVSACSCWLVG
jgi:hypothetical protein